MYSIELQMEELVEIIEKTIEVRINIEKEKLNNNKKMIINHFRGILNMIQKIYLKIIKKNQVYDIMKNINSISIF